MDKGENPGPTTGLCDEDQFFFPGSQAQSVEVVSRENVCTIFKPAVAPGIERDGSEFPDESIFSEVVATISSSFMGLVGSSRSTLIDRLRLEANVLCEDNKENGGQCLLRGSLPQLIVAHRLMARHLGGCDAKEEARSGGVCDKNVMCDIIKLDKLSDFAMKHPRKARFPSLLSRQAATAVRDKYRAQRMADVKRRRLLCKTGLEPLSAQRNGAFGLQDSSTDVLGKKFLKQNYEELSPFKFFCKSCSFKTKRESHYSRHLLIHDKVKTLYSCESCSFTTIRLSHLRRHEMSHSQTTYNCDRCSYKTDEMKLLKRHTKLRHRGNNEDEDEDSRHRGLSETLRCDKCSYATNKPYHYQRHQRAHRSAGGRKGGGRACVFQCDKCPYKTTRKEHYNRHTNNVHSNKRPYLCDFCGNAFKRPDALKQHRMTHGLSDPRTVQFRCPVCQKKCRSAAHVAEHQAVHSNVRAFLCEICGASFKTRSVQRKHVVTIHKNPRSFPCTHCYKKFNTNYALRRHLRLHLTFKEDVGEMGEPPDLALSSSPTVPDDEFAPVIVSIKEDPEPVSLESGPPVFVQTAEASTALLYLTSSFTSTF